MTPEQVRARMAGTWITAPNGRLLASAEIPEWLNALAPVVVEIVEDAIAAQSMIRLCNALGAIADGEKLTVEGLDVGPGYMAPAHNDPAMQRGGAS